MEHGRRKKSGGELKMEEEGGDRKKRSHNDVLRTSSIHLPLLDIGKRRRVQREGERKGEKG